MEVHMNDDDGVAPERPQAADGLLARRGFMRLAGTTALGVSAAGMLAACGGVKGGTSSGGGGSSAVSTIKIGYVSPETGPLAPFGQADAFVLSQMRSYFGKHGITVAGQKHPVQIVVKDSQSTDSTASSVANDLILNSGVNLMLVSSTPDTTNPVSDACEANNIPCISTVAPWQSWFAGRNGTIGATRAASSSFHWTYHFFWGLEDLEAIYLDMWGAVPTNKIVGGLWPNDSDGNAFASKTTGIPAAVEPHGYKVIDPGRYADGTTDFSAQISRFKSANVEIFAGVPIPPDFTTFWKQAYQQGFRPKVANVAKALLFPSAVDALGGIAENLATEVWWSPTHPFSSSLTGQSSAQLAAAYTASAKKQWTQPIGFAHALFEVANAALTKAKSLSPADIVAAISELKVSTVVGPLDWTSGPVKNVAKTPLVGGQWRKSTAYPYELTIVSNSQHPNIPAAGHMEAITYA
jgi:branched-chain amino acid transport system substrate-binding protein